MKVVIDHVMPVALGGSNHPDNLAISCFQCNMKKGSLHPRVAELWLQAGLPRCWALDIFDFEEGRPAERAFFLGAEFITLEDGKREVVRLPIAGGGKCTMKSCPDCADA